jgi:hypothetical protein
MAADGSVSGSVAWNAITGKPFNDVDGTDLDVNASNEIYIKRDTFGTVRVKNGATVTDLEASGDSIVQIEAGSNVTITADDTATPKKLVINSTGGTGSVNWGSIGGTLSNQTDLQNALNAKANSTDIHDSTITIQKNGATVDSFTTNASSNKSINILTDDWVATGTVSSGSVSFSGVDDTGNYGYEVFVQITASSTNKNPSAQISSISGTGTSSMSVTYTTDADNGATCKLRRIK